jgi:peptidyl-prolyl cis-trans isomerase NIMA-interacting 1
VNSGQTCAALLALSEMWVKKESKSRAGKFYYYNTESKATTWERPGDYVSGSSGSSKRKGDDGGGGSSKQPRGETVQALHLLRKHKDVRRPQARGQPITRTLDQAREEVVAFRAQVEAAATAAGEGEAAAARRAKFEELAEESSDCSSGRSKKGDLGPFTREKMMKPFSDAAFALAVGGMSDLVTTDSGVHIILRIA